VNIVRIWEGYRRVGVNYGLPVHYVDIGPSIRMEPLEVVKRLRDLGLDLDRWVVFGSGFASEKGAMSLLEALRAVRIHIEVEDDGSSQTPTWFPTVDRWILYWTGKLTFNFGALRPNRDFLVCMDENIEKFLEETSNFQAVKAWVVEEPDKVYEEAKKLGIRVYKKDTREV
jgi:hypothetical protein